VQAIADVFNRPFSTGDREGKEFVARSASIGAASSPADGMGFATIFSHADAALAAAKARGHGSILLYTPGMEGDALRRAELRNELGVAVAENQFTLYYQPHVDLITGAVTGCEALIRWNHPVRGLVMPGQFIPFAEQIGFIGQIDAWVMRNAFEAARAVGGEHPGFRLYFNLSGRQVGDASIVHAFVEAARNGVELGRIGVEITETDAMRDVVATRRVCRALRRLNVRIAIDDFGTGYSSLSSLKLLPVDIVKIDRSFIAGIQNDPHDGAIAETIIAIADRFGFESLGEGAEELEEVAWLRHHGCRYVQGYAIAHPLPLEEFVGWLETWKPSEPPASALGFTGAA
jgi:EAL domain-containing protein (putative c-di-GMP-specific phosphodiesterase class I)